MILKPRPSGLPRSSLPALRSGRVITEHCVALWIFVMSQASLISNLGVQGSAGVLAENRVGVHYQGFGLSGPGVHTPDQNFLLASQALETLFQWGVNIR